MKTVYLLAWITNALILTTFVTTKHPAMFLVVMNLILPTMLLIIRQLLLHAKVDENDKFPI